LGLSDNSREVSTTKMEKDMDMKLSKLSIGRHPLIRKVDAKTYMFLVGIQEGPGLRDNKTSLDLHQTGAIFEYPTLPMNNAKPKFQPLTQQFNNNPGAPITA
jgi:hypothetical protein